MISACFTKSHTCSVLVRVEASHAGLAIATVVAVSAVQLGAGMAVLGERVKVETGLAM